MKHACLLSHSIPKYLRRYVKLSNYGTFLRIVRFHNHPILLSYPKGLLTCRAFAILSRWLHEFDVTKELYDGVKFSSTKTASYTGAYWTLNIDKYIVSICSFNNVHGLEIKVIVAIEPPISALCSIFLIIKM